MTSLKLLSGFEEPAPVQTNLKAGPFTMIYENGCIRYIKYGNSEIVRMIYMALRDKNWGTYVPEIRDEKISVHENSFFITYQCDYKEKDMVIFSWNAVIQGEESGKIIFTISGSALSALVKNRAGFCILHPIANTAGEKLIVTCSDNHIISTFFPSSIAPQIPLNDIKKLNWFNNGHEYAIEMEGDIFEMEDHRNWTDASFKTFCTPLSKPYPVRLEAGDTVNQQVLFFSVDPLNDPGANGNNVIHITVNESESTSLPAIGVGASTEINVLSPYVQDVLGLINFQYYYTETRTSEKKWHELLLGEIDNAKLSHLPLFISLQLSTDNFEEEFEAFKKIIEQDISILKYLLIVGEDKSVTEQFLIDWAIKNIKSFFPSILLGMGTTTNFAELNRNRRKVHSIDFVSYAIHPQEHAFDNLSLIENMAAQKDTVESAAKIYNGKKIAISPVTLRRRFNPYAQNKEEIIRTNSQKSDPRQDSLWCAGWTLGSIKYLSEAGAGFISFFQTVGKQGICDYQGNLYPVACLFQFINTMHGAKVVRTSVNNPLECTSLLLLKENQKYLLLCNHTSKALKLQLPFTISTIRSIEVFPLGIIKSAIDKTSVIELDPYSVVIVN
jgi:hypothetical protein